GVASDDAAALARLAENLDVTINRPSVDDGRLCDVLIGGRDVTWQLRSPEVDRAISAVSAHPDVRAALLPQQRRIGRAGRIVMVGRDIGTVVMPDAELKVFLEASPEERARRRCAERVTPGAERDYQSILEDIRRRD